MRKPVLSFKRFVEYFPAVELPIQLTDETHHVFSKENQILPQDFVHSFLVPDSETPDPYTEYLPCFRIDQLGSFLGLVFWKASLMEYSYFLMTYDQHRNRVAQQIIAGTKSNGKTVLTRQCTIDVDGTISVTEGLGTPDGSYDPQTTRRFQFELLDSGDILHMVDPLDN